MTQMHRLERELTDWFAETAVPRTPDYAEDILRRTAGIRQRPRWSFPGRWTPMWLRAFERTTVRPVPWRTIGLLVILALLVAAALVAVGTRPRVPAPFGSARNGLVAYSPGDSDIWTVDPMSGERRAIVVGPTVDHDPRFSLDGRRLAFLRETGAGAAVVVVNADGTNPTLVTTEPLVQIDTDGIAWSPDGRSIAVSATLRGPPAIFLLGTAGGGVRSLPVPYQYMEVYWRPPDGRQLVFLGGTPSDLGLFLVSPADGRVQEIGLPDGQATALRLLGWTPDGRRFAYQREEGPEPFRTRLLDLASGTESILQPSYGHLSNNGRRIVGIVEDRAGLRLCVAFVDGGPCRRIGDASHVPEGTSHERIFWSPDDEWIVVRPEGRGAPVLLDPDGGAAIQPSWIGDGAASWQRLAP